MPEWVMEFLKVYGPNAVPWIGLAYLGNWHLKRADAEIDAKVQFAVAINGMAKIIEDLRKQ